MNTLAATARTPGTKGDARKLRKTGLMPAVMYGPDDAPVHISVDPIQLETIFRKSQDRNTVVDIELDGKKMPTLVRDVQRHPLKRHLVHADFYRVSKKRKVQVMLPVIGTGTSAGAILGGRMRIIRREIKASCDFDKIPKELVVDITTLTVGDMVKASEIPLPVGVELIYDNDFNVLTIYGKSVRGAAAEAETEAVVEAEG